MSITRLLKFGCPKIAPMIGLIRFSVNEVTKPANASARISPMAISTRFPFEMNSLNSLIMALLLPLAL